MHGPGQCLDLPLPPKLRTINAMWIGSWKRKKNIRKTSGIPMKSAVQSIALQLIKTVSIVNILVLTHVDWSQPSPSDSFTLGQAWVKDGCPVLFLQLSVHLEVLQNKKVILITTLRMPSPEGEIPRFLLKNLAQCLAEAMEVTGMLHWVQILADGCPQAG